MVRALAAKLAEWAADPDVTRVIVTASGERAFCAGGDIRALYELGKSDRYIEALRFWRDEYSLNAYIKRYPKPYIALMEGVVMGGGVGLSAHGSHRVAGDRFVFAMPEVGIGFFPDVGATWFLPRMPGNSGVYCALTGERLKVSDAIAVGFITHYVPTQRWPGLMQELAGSHAVDAALAHFSALPPNGPLASRRGAIDRMFAGDSVEQILRELDDEAIRGREHSGFAAVTAALIRAKSPLSLKVALMQMRRGAQWSFVDCMRTEFRIVSRIIQGHDFYEGVRAAIIDKDQAPAWKPARLSGVDSAAVERHFAPLGHGELDLT